VGRRMEGVHPSFEHFGQAGDVGDGDHRDPLLLEGLERAAGIQLDLARRNCQCAGGCQKPATLDVERAGDFMVVMEPDGYNVLPDRSFVARVEELFGRGAVRIVD